MYSSARLAFLVNLLRFAGSAQYLQRAVISWSVFEDISSSGCGHRSCRVRR